MAWTQASRRLRWSSFSEKTFWLLVSSARISFLWPTRRKKDNQNMASRPYLTRQFDVGPSPGKMREGGAPLRKLTSASGDQWQPSKSQKKALSNPSVSSWSEHPGTQGQTATSMVRQAKALVTVGREGLLRRPSPGKACHGRGAPGDWESRACFLLTLGG